MGYLLVTINPGLQITGQLPVGFVGEAYSATLTARAGLAPYTLTVLSALPDGLTATDNGDGTLTIAGTPTETFSGSVIVRAQDGAGKIVQRSLTLVVLPQPVIVEYLLLESGDFLLLESGDKILLE